VLELSTIHRNGILAGIWVEKILKTKNYVRESKWSQSIAVGSKSFAEGIKEKLGIRAKGRKVGESGADSKTPYMFQNQEIICSYPFFFKGHSNALNLDGGLDKSSSV